MPHAKPHPYRTVGTLLLFGAMMLAAMWLCPEAARAGIAPVAIGALSSLGLYSAGKSAFEKHTDAKVAAVQS
jgi:hypothetical protein